jgi:hypothetical protein
MSALYLIDRHGSPVTSANILDVQDSTMPVLSGRFVVKVPDGIPIVQPTDLGDLLTKKAQGYLLFYAGFTRVTYDDLLDTTHVDAASSKGLITGERSTLVLQPGGILQSTVVPLTGSAPSQAFITWDTYNYVETDSATTLYVRQYNELPSTPSNVTCSASFDGGVNFNATTDGAVLNVPVPQQGTNFIIRLTNTSTSRLSIGSWTVVY